MEDGFEDIYVSKFTANLSSADMDMITISPSNKGIGGVEFGLLKNELNKIVIEVTILSSPEKKFITVYSSNWLIN